MYSDVVPLGLDPFHPHHAYGISIRSPQAPRSQHPRPGLEPHMEGKDRWTDGHRAGDGPRSRSCMRHGRWFVKAPQAVFPPMSLQGSGSHMDELHSLHHLLCSLLALLLQHRWVLPPHAPVARGAAVQREGSRAVMGTLVLHPLGCAVLGVMAGCCRGAVQGCWQRGDIASARSRAERMACFSPALQL